MTRELKTGYISKEVYESYVREDRLNAIREKYTRSPYSFRENQTPEENLLDQINLLADATNALEDELSSYEKFEHEDHHIVLTIAHKEMVTRNQIETMTETLTALLQDAYVLGLVDLEGED